MVLSNAAKALVTLGLLSVPLGYHLLSSNDDNFDVVIVGGGPAGENLGIELYLHNINKHNFNVGILGAGYKSLYDVSNPAFWPWLTDVNTGTGVYPVIANPYTATTWTVVGLAERWAARRSQYYPDVKLRGGQSTVNGGVLGVNSGQYYTWHGQVLNDPVGYDFNYIIKRRAKLLHYDGPSTNTTCYGDGSGRFWFTEYEPESSTQALMLAASRVLGVAISDSICEFRSTRVMKFGRAIQKLNLSASEPWKRWRRGQFDDMVFQSYEAQSNGRLRYIEGAYATKLDWNDDNDKVKGVYYIKEGREYKVKAKMEVIVTAGVRNTVEFGLRNGLGPRAELEALGIDVIKDLPLWGKKWHDDFGYQTQFVSLIPEARIAPAGASITWPSSFNLANNDTLSDLQLATCLVTNANIPGFPVPLAVHLYLIKVLGATSRGTIGLFSREYYTKLRLEYPVQEVDYERFCEALNMTRAFVANSTTPMIEIGSSAPLRTCDQLKNAIRTDTTLPILNDYHDTAALLASGLDSRGKIPGIRGLRFSGNALFLRSNDGHDAYGASTVWGMLTAKFFCLEHGCSSFSM